VPECPENAIYAQDDVPADQQQFIKINAELARLWPVITKSKAPMTDYEKWSGVAGKQQYLHR
jgi:ferredoxin